MCVKISLKDFPEVSIVDEEGKTNKDAIIKEGKELSISNPYDSTFTIKIESYHDDIIKGEVSCILGDIFKDIAEKKVMPHLSLHDNVELTDIDYVKQQEA